MAVSHDDLRRLAGFFPEGDLEWRIGSTTRDNKKGMALVYVTNRAIMARLDDVCGPGNWRNEYDNGPEGGVLCGLSILVQRDENAEWVTKWDGAENTDYEGVKGGLSGSMKRAAVQWGIGRYLYEMPQQWVELDDRKRMKKSPRVPAKFLPQSQPDPDVEKKRRAQKVADEVRHVITDAKREIKAERSAYVDQFAEFEGRFQPPAHPEQVWTWALDKWREAFPDEDHGPKD